MTTTLHYTDLSPILTTLSMTNTENMLKLFIMIGNSERFAIKSIISLCKDKPHYPSVKRRPLLQKLASTPIKEPLNRADGLLTKFLSIIEKRNIIYLSQNKNPYWMKNIPYDLMEVFGTCVQFIDQHNAPLPKTTLPPSHDVESFINKVLLEKQPVTIDRQFEILLDITKNNVIGAANLGMIATRLMSRFSEQRVYPTLTIGNKLVTSITSDEEIGVIMSGWFAQVARFEIFNDTLSKNDGSGDQYYFWTHFFAACIFDSNSIKDKAMQKMFEKGNDIMIFVKNNIAKRSGVISDHHEASLLGRTIGLAISIGSNKGVVRNFASAE